MLGRRVYLRTVVVLIFSNVDVRFSNDLYLFQFIFLSSCALPDRNFDSINSDMSHMCLFQ